VDVEPLLWVRSTSPPPTAPPVTAYSLFVTSTSAFAGEVIDIASGTRKNVAVDKKFNDWGEIQRTFMFDPKRILFYLLQANFTSPNPIRDIILWTIHPHTGVVEDIVVQGAKHQGDVDVTGYAFNPKTNRITFATRLKKAQG
jgi:hypothetical protein